MKFIFRNIMSFMKTEKMLFFVMVLCVFASSFIMCFSFGLYANYDTIRVMGDIKSRYCGQRLQNGVVTKGEFQRFVEAIPEDTAEAAAIFGDVDMSEVLGKNHGTMPLRLGRKDGKYVTLDGARDAFDNNAGKLGGDCGRYFTDEEYSEGKLVAHVPGESKIFGYEDFDAAKNYKIGDTLELFGKEFEIIGRTRNADSPTVPIQQVPDDLKMTKIIVQFGKTMTRKQYNDIKKAADECIPGALEFPPLRLPDNDEYLITLGIILISIMIAGLSVINFAMLYLFILRKRKNSLAVMRLCGASKLEAAAIYLGECLVTSVPVFGLGAFAFNIMLDNVFDELFPYMKQAFAGGSYFVIFAVYIAVMLAIMIPLVAKNVNVKIKDCLAEGKI